MTSGRQELARSPRRQLLDSGSQGHFSFVVGIMLGTSAAIVGVQWHVVPLSPSQLIVIAAAALVVFKYPERVRKYQPNMIDCSMVVFIFIMLTVEVFNAQQLLREPAPYVSFTWLGLYLAFIAARLTSETREECLSLLGGMLIMAPIVAVLGVLQTLNLPWVINLTVLLTEGGPSALDRYLEEGMLVRATGLTGHWTGFGSYLAAMALCAVVRMRLFGSHWRSILSLAVIGAGVVSTLTISVIAIYASVVVLYFVGEKRIGRLALFMAVSVGVVASTFSDEVTRRFDQQYGSGATSMAASSGIIPETLVFRMSVWKNETIPAISERFLSGWGAGVYGGRTGWLITPDTIVWKSSESQWFGIFMQAGFLGFIAMTFLLVSFFIVIRYFPRGARGMVTCFLLFCFMTSLTVSVFTNAGLGGALIPLLGALSGTFALGMEREPDALKVSRYNNRES